MLKQLKLTNFRQHRDVTVDFGPGMQIIRAQNEGGKTTLIEAFLYAAFGSRSLRTSIDDAVTWGENVRTLKVEATVEFGGEQYVFIRSKAGAEVTREGQVYVSGQTEVTNFAAKLIGADANTATNLMLANQSNMRGTLEQGPKATSELVEGLAEFDFFDHLLERMQERLALGSDVSARQRLEDAQERLENMSAEKPDTSEWERVVELAPAMVKELQDKIEQQLQPAYDAARQALDQAKNSRSTFDLLNNNLLKATGNLEQAQAQLIAAQCKMEPVDTSQIKQLQAQLDEINGLEAKVKVFQKLNKLNATYPEAHWEGDAASLQAEIEKTETEIETLSSQLAVNKQQTSSLSQEITALQKQIQKDDHCSACGQLLQDHEEIAKRNDELAKRIADLHMKVVDLGPAHGELSTQLAERKSELADLKGVLGCASAFDSFIREHAQHLQVDTNFVPAKLSWKGVPPDGDLPDAGAIERQIREIEAADKASKEAAARVTALTEAIEGFELQVKQFREQVQAYDVVNVDAMQQANDTAYSDLFRAQQQIKTIEAEAVAAKHQIALATQSYEQRKTQIAELEQAVKTCQKEVEDLAFNNALLKKVRASRGPVTDKLWNLVLSAVSTMFTQMRGTDSVVTKDKDGFKVNGEEVASLSGSTLDILALAIRCALTKTFLPSTSLLILDEPAAAMDSSRAEKMLGFLQTTGFAQTILITHEESSSAVADNLVTL